MLLSMNIKQLIDPKVTYAETRSRARILELDYALI